MLYVLYMFSSIVYSVNDIYIDDLKYTLYTITLT